jgi:N-acyl-D-aspartate/D-glutamate deacylase
MTMAHWRVALILVVGASGCARTGAPVTPRIDRFDVLIRGGIVVDGTGAKAYRADVGVIGDAIAAVGNLAGASAGTTVDAAGMLVAPGFINIHSHARRDALAAPANMLRQGVTTEIGNADGAGPVGAAGFAGADTNAMGVNYGVYTPFNTIWGAVVGASDSRPTRIQTDSMRAVVRRDLSDGSWGVSAGLDYQPAFFATTDEVVAVLEVARPWRTNFPNHDRVSVDNGYSSLAGMRQTLVIGERAGLVPVVTHMKLQGHEQGRAREAIRMFDSVEQRGQFVAADVYPYLAGQTALSALLIPGWAAAGGRDSMLMRFRDSTARSRIAREMMEAIRARFGSPENIMVSDRGKNVAQLVSELGVTSAPDAVMALLTERQRGVIITFGIEPDLVDIMRWPNAAIACDCGAGTTQTHPRYYGSFPRVFGRYVREQRVMSWEDAIRKMTMLPASIIGMVDRGAIAVGMAADIVVFDSAAVIDRATFEQPMQNPEGVQHVLVNGRFVLRDGTPTGAAGGKILRRGTSMPSRPANFAVARGVTVNAPNVTVRLTQSPADRSARGHLQITTPSLSLRATSLGLLQTTGGWAAISGRGVIDGVERAFVLLLDEHDPLEPASSWATVLVPGSAQRRIPLARGSVVVSRGE